MAAISVPFGIQHFVFRICETKPATARKPRETEPWTGFAHFGADAARVVWMNGTDTIYDGVDCGPLYSRASLDADIAAADLVLAAIRSPQVIESDDDDMMTELKDALKHVHAAVHLHTEPRADWLQWIFDRLPPQLPELNSRGKPKLKHRGVSKSKPKCACSREQFAAKLTGLRSSEITLLWRDHKNNKH
jgi:hypothetical protein